MDSIRTGMRYAIDPKQTRWVAPLLFVADALLCSLIVWKIPYTEIDWKAYMQQVEKYAKGERDYVKIYGDTGPLVYPAAHVYIYRVLHYLTDGGHDIFRAQIIFTGLYLTSLLLVMQCYRRAEVPPYVFGLLILSKRLHSIFILRLFNDGFAAFFLFLAIYLFQLKQWTLGSLSYAMGLGLKMTLLLALPAVGAVLWQAMGRERAVGQATFLVQIQVLLGYPFLATNWKSYLSRAFEFTRQFLYKWTVNWRFIGEETFLSRDFSYALLAAHGSLLVLFMSTSWLKPGDTSMFEILAQLLGRTETPSPARQAQVSKKITPEFIMTAMLSAVVIGCLCARSLHYQFYAYIAWSTPFLLWRSGAHPAVQCCFWAAQEWAWNVYPSTSASSAVVVSCLAVAVSAAWIGGRDAGVGRQRP